VSRATLCRPLRCDAIARLEQSSHRWEVGVCNVNSQHSDRMGATTSSLSEHTGSTPFEGPAPRCSQQGIGATFGDPIGVLDNTDLPPSQGRADGRVGLMAERRTSSRTSSTPIESSSVRTSVTSGCEPDSDVRHAVHFPQPPEPHCSAAAKARARRI
jgi:hypothetical protein